MELKDNQPRHEQISEWLRNQITTGKLKPGEKLPSEKELGSQFDVSRVTVRHALQTLENDNMIYRRQGLGSFVSNKKIEQPMAFLHDFDEEMGAAGMEASSKIICFEKVEPTEQLCSLLGLSESSILMRLDRVRYGDGEPMAFDQTWLPIFYGQLLEGQDLQEQTIYQILEQEYEIPILSGRYHITAECASKEIADYLDVKKITPLLVIDRLSCTIGQKKVYYQKRYLRPDRISYQLFLERPNEESGNQASSIKEFMPVFRR